LSILKTLFPGFPLISQQGAYFPSWGFAELPGSVFAPLRGQATPSPPQFVTSPHRARTAKVALSDLCQPPLNGLYSVSVPLAPLQFWKNYRCFPSDSVVAFCLCGRRCGPRRASIDPRRLHSVTSASCRPLRSFFFGSTRFS